MTQLNYTFNTELQISAEDEDQARDALLYWLNEMVRADDSSLFDIVGVIERGSVNKVTIKGVDWSLLSKQKQWLLQQTGDEADGLIHLLDALEDDALELGIIDEEHEGGCPANDGFGCRCGEGDGA